MNAHWHREFEILRVLSGSFTVYLNSAALELSEGDVVFIEGGTLHRGQPSDCVYECVVVDLKMLLSKQDGVTEGYLSKIINSTASIKSAVSRDDRVIYGKVTELFENLREEKPYYELSVYGALFTLLSEMYANGYISSENRTHTTKQTELIGSVIDWLNRNYKEPVTSKRLSEISSLNFNYLCKIFKSFTGQTITEYLNELRIEHACYDIARKGKTVTEAAFGNGFNDLSYFAKTFKRYKGMSPREFKRLIR
jgi:AraC-like DNA-binding protein